MLLYVASRVWDERDANKALELIERIYSLWWEVNSLLHGKEVAERVLSGNASPGDVKVWSEVYKSMTPQQIDQLIQQKLRELQDAENQLKQLLAKYNFSQQEIDKIVQSIKQSTPYKHQSAGQVQQRQEAQQHQEAVLPSGVTYVSQEQAEQRREQPRVVVTGLRQAIVLPKNVKRVAIPA